MKTTYMTHFRSVADCIIQIRTASGGARTHLFEGAKVLVDLVGMDKFESEFKKAMIDLEAEYSERLDEGETLTSIWPAFKVRKSELLRAIKAGKDPRKFESATKFVKSVAETESNTGNSAGKGNKGGKTGDNPVKLHPVTNSMSDKLKAKLDLVTKHLAKLDEDTALKVLEDCDTAIHRKLRSVGGAFANVKAATS